MFDAERGPELIEFVFSAGLAGAASEESVGELLAVICEDLPDLERAGLFEGFDKAHGNACGLMGLDLHEHPACGAIDGHEQLARTAIGQGGQIFHIPVQEA